MLAPSSVRAVVPCITVGLLAAALVRIGRTLSQKRSSTAVVIKRVCALSRRLRATASSATGATTVTVTVLANWTIRVRVTWTSGRNMATTLVFECVATAGQTRKVQAVVFAQPRALLTLVSDQAAISRPRSTVGVAIAWNVAAASVRVGRADGQKLVAAAVRGAAHGVPVRAIVGLLNVGALFAPSTLVAELELFTVCRVFAAFVRIRGTSRTEHGVVAAISTDGIAVRRSNVATSFTASERVAVVALAARRVVKTALVRIARALVTKRSIATVVNCRALLQWRDVTARRTLMLAVAEFLLGAVAMHCARLSDNVTRAAQRQHHT